MTDYENIIYELREAAGGNVAYITLNRPERLNALSRGLLADVGSALEEADKDETVRCIVIKGAGRAFSAGYDMNVQSEGNLPRDALTHDYQRPIPRRCIAVGSGAIASRLSPSAIHSASPAVASWPATVTSPSRRTTRSSATRPARYASVATYMIWPELVGMKKIEAVGFHRQHDERAGSPPRRPGE